MDALETTTAIAPRRIAGRIPAIGLAVLSALSMVLVAAVPATAALPAHGGTFECYYDAAGNRFVKAHLPAMKSATGGEQVYWFAQVYKKTSSGVTLVGNTRGGNLATGWANQNGVVSGAFVPGYKWIDYATNNGLIHGGALKVPGPGTYQVAGRFWWSSFSTAYTGKWATYWNNPGSITCTFGR